MAAPTFVAASAGATDAGGAWTGANFTVVAGELLILQILQDGTGAAGQVTLSTLNRIADLAGTSGVMTSVGAFDVGSAVAARQHLYLGRASASGADAFVSGGNSGTDDLYFRVYRFANVSLGTTLATVIENGSAGGSANGAGTGTTVPDTGVTTLGPDRLALQFGAVNDDVVYGPFVGETGGDWNDDGQIQQYATATGTDGALVYLSAAMPSAGTINGGTVELGSSAAWGVVGFALIGTTVAAAPGPAWRRKPAHRFLTLR